MYISLFWCGVIATVLFEVGAIIVSNIFFSLKKKRTTK